MTQPAPSSLLERIDRAIASVEGALVLAVLVVMIALATLQLFLQKAFDAGLPWADIVVRQMVLWIGFLGGALATYKGRHIAIDAVGKFLSPRVGAGVQVVTSLAAAVLTALLCAASITFVQDELSNGSTLFGETPSWPFKAVMPLAFAAIVFHFLVWSWRAALIATGKRPPPAHHSGMEGAVEDLVEKDRVP